MLADTPDRIRKRCKVLRALQVLLIPVLVLYCAFLFAEVSTEKILASTVKAFDKCLKWKVIGECFWLKCGLTGCSVRVSVKIGHYRPDSVVSVYPTIHSHPWSEVKLLVEGAFEAVKPTLDDEIVDWIEGSGTDPAMDSFSRTRNLRYFEADLVGHPLIDIEFPGADYICDSVTRPLNPYYISLLDLLAWRNPSVEGMRMASLTPGRREIGSWPVNTWGSVFPRSGWIVQPSPPKAAAVIAQRAADIAINGGPLRIRSRMSHGKVNLWPPYRIRENNAATAKWQMIHPIEKKNCSVFGSNDLLKLADWGGGKVDKKNSYLWALWRPYKCCPRRGQVFLGSDDVHGYP